MIKRKKEISIVKFSMTNKRNPIILGLQTRQKGFQEKRDIVI